MSEIQRLSAYVADAIFEGDTMMFHDELMAVTADFIYTAIVEGYEIDLAKINYASKNKDMADSLKRNGYKLAGYKNYHFIKDLKKLLIDPKTKTRRALSEYKRLFKKIDDAYNNRWIVAEYQHAVASARMASKWVAMPDTALLEYLTVEDGRVRPEHREWNGIVRPKNDPFWNTYWPPNGWGCRCTVREVTNILPQTDIGKVHDVDGPMFATNTAKSGVIFPAKHPYFKVGRRKKEVDAFWKRVYSERVTKQF